MLIMKYTLRYGVSVCVFLCVCWGWRVGRIKSAAVWSQVSLISSLRVLIGSKWDKRLQFLPMTKKTIHGSVFLLILLFCSAMPALANLIGLQRHKEVRRFQMCWDYSGTSCLHLLPHPYSHPYFSLWIISPLFILSTWGSTMNRAQQLELASCFLSDMFLGWSFTNYFSETTVLVRP